MKRIYLLIIITLLFIKTSYSQEMNKEVLMFGVGVGPNNDFVGAKGLSPVIRLTIEKGMFDIGPGILAIGGETGAFYQQYNNYGFKAKYSAFILAGRVAYYYNFRKLLDVRQFNAYAGNVIGLRFVSDNNTNKEYNMGGVFPHFGAFVGANYFFKENIAGFVEAGYDVSWGTIGLNFTL